MPHDRIGGWQTGLELVRPTKTTLPPVTIAAVQDFGLARILHMSPDEISYGQRRLVAIARAVAAQPSVLLLDEPAAGLTEHESREFRHLVRRLADTWGMAVMVIEHDMGFVMSICDRITLIDFGKFVCEGSPAEIRTNPAAIAAYLGDEHGRIGRGRSTASVRSRPTERGVRSECESAARGAWPLLRLCRRRDRPRPNARSAAGRGRGAARRQRRGQDDDAAHPGRRAERARRRGPLEGPQGNRAAAQTGAQWDGISHRGTLGVPEPHDPSEPGGRPRRHRQRHHAVPGTRRH